MKRLLLAMLVWVLGVSFAFSQNPVVTQPYPVTSFNSSSTVTVTNTFQSVFAAFTAPVNRGRAGCTIQNNGSNSMWVYFGAIAGATKGKSVVLAAGASVNCGIFGSALQDQVSVTGTSGDAFFANQW